MALPSPARRGTALVAVLLVSTLLGATAEPAKTPLDAAPLVAPSPDVALPAIEGPAKPGTLSPPPVMGEGISTGEWVVGFHEVPDLADGLLYGAPVKRVDAALGFAIAIPSDPAAFQEAAGADPNVAYVEENLRFRMVQSTPNDPLYPSQYGPQQINADDAWDTTLGDLDAAVCIIDTGVRYTHQDIVGPRWLGGFDFVDNDAIPLDGHGHGTHVAGTAAATINNAVGVAGIGNVGIYGVRVLDNSGSGAWADVASGIDWCRQNTMARTVISLSLGGFGAPASLETAVNNAVAAGKPVVAAAGNSGPCTNCVIQPASYANAIAVTCTTSSETQCSFSSEGPEADIAAPGNVILAPCFTSDTDYCTMSGTSMSTPHVSGGMALVWSHLTGLTGAQLRTRLETTAQDLGPAGWDVKYGHGEIDVKCLLDNTSPCGGSPPPTACETPGPDAFGYVCNVVPYAFTDISGTGTALVLADDQMSGAVPIGFAFDYYGSTHTQAYVSSNGFLSFTAGSYNGCCSGQSMPDPADPNNVVAGYWEDLYPPGGGTIKYQTVGASPNQRFIVQWTAVPHYCCAGNVPVTFQIVLEENGDGIEVHMQSTPTDGGFHVTGIEDAAGTTGLRYRSGSFSETNRGVRFSFVAPPSCETPGPDAFGYTCTPIPYAFTDISGTGTALLLGDDQTSGAVPIGFLYDHYGTLYANAYVSSNGFVSFDAGASNGCCSGQMLPNAAAPNNLVAGFWEDLYPPGGGSITYQTTGTSPNQRFIVQWTNVPHYFSGNPVTFQIVLYEDSNDAEVHFQSAPTDGGFHVTGIEDAAGTVGLRYKSGSFAETNTAVRFVHPPLPLPPLCKQTWDGMQLLTYPCAVTCSTPLQWLMSISFGQGTFGQTVDGTLSCPSGTTWTNTCGAALTGFGACGFASGPITGGLPTCTRTGGTFPATAPNTAWTVHCVPDP